MFKFIVGMLLVVPPPQIHAREQSYPDRLFATGGQNAWKKYRAYCRMRPEDCNAVEMIKVESTFANLPRQETKSVPPDVDEPTIGPVPVIPKTAPHVNPMSRRPRVTVVPVDPSRLVREAERARAQGQLESALKYYELAEKINPATQEFRLPIDELRKAME